MDAVTLRVRSPSEVESTWAPSFEYVPENDTLVVSFTFDAETSELTEAGWWVLYAEMTLAGGGVLRSDPRAIRVRGRFETPGT